MKIAFVCFCLIMMLISAVNFGIALKYCKRSEKLYIGGLTAISEALLIAGIIVMINKI